MKRLHGAFLATSIAEYFRDKGLNVLLLMDSLTRFAQAQREVALAIGEPPATKGYPPSVFSLIPQLVERAGNSKVTGGSITGFYTVLTESDDPNDPIADSSRAILDGHIILNREIAEKGIYPAIDIEMSISRVMNDITTSEHMEMARSFREIYSRYNSNLDLINLGAYKEGSNREIDLAIRSYPMLINFLRQDVHSASDYHESRNRLFELMHSITPGNE
jgi:flagellum-specific ATP synthase